MSNWVDCQSVRVRTLVKVHPHKRLPQQSKATIYYVWKLTKGSGQTEKSLLKKKDSFLVRTEGSGLAHIHLSLLPCPLPSPSHGQGSHEKLGVLQPTQRSDLLWSCVKSFPPTRGTVSTLSRPTALCKSSTSKELLLLGLRAQLCETDPVPRVWLKTMATQLPKTVISFGENKSLAKNIRGIPGDVGNLKRL